MIAFATFCLAATGFVISLYFTGVFYGRIPADVFWMPQVCRMTRGACLSVLDTPRAKLFGLPNSLFGLFAYAYFILDLFFFPPVPGLVLAAVAFARSLYLACSLAFVTRLPCPLCWTSHAINLLLFLIYVRILF